VPNFQELFPNADPLTVKAEIVEALEANVEGWESKPGNLVDWLNDVKARLWTILMKQASTMGAAAFGTFGRTIAKVPPILAAPATVTSTWTAIDEDGHTIEDGTEVKVPVPGGEPLGFVVVGDVTVAPGDNATAAGEVLLQAIEPGVAGNELSGEATPISTVAFVDTIVLVGETSGGVDEEDEDTYLNRLTEKLQTLSLSLILPRDVEIDARDTAGVARALCMPAYNIKTETAEALAVSVIPADAAGASSSAPVKEDLEVSQKPRLLSGVNYYVGDPTHSKVDAFSSIAVADGFDPATIEEAVEARKAAYLDPANWGIPSTGDPWNSPGWENRTKVYYNELISEIDRVPGVDRVVSLLIGGGAGKAFTVAAATDKLTSTAHGFSNGDAVVLRAGLTPGFPLVHGVVAYVRDVEANAFKLALTVGGAAINITSDGSGTVVKLGTSDVTLAGVAPLTEPGEIGVTVV
jgi:Baseplate J-like protein